MTLAEGQYQIGNFVFGARTMVKVTAEEAVSYTTNPGDYQNPLSDEMRFGRDFIAPGSLQMELGVIDNYALDGSTIPGLKSGTELIEEMMREWRADDYRLVWGFVKPLKYCKQGEERRIYGRPRRFAQGRRRPGVEFIPCTVDYARSDTFSYSEEEFGVAVTPSAPGTTTANITRSGGEAPTWVEIFIVGPITDPTIKIGSQVIEIDYALAAGKVIQINTYPWERRCVDSDGFNLSPKMIGVSPYLDQIKVPPNSITGVGLSGGGTSVGVTQAIFNWREAYHTF